MGTTTAPDTEGIQISVDAVVGGAPVGSVSPIGHIDSMGPIVDKSRDVKKYTPMNNNQFDEIAAFGSLKQGDLTFKILWDPEGTEGVNKIETAIDNNTEVQIVFEINNSLGANGTKLTHICKASSFKADGEKDGKFIADLTLVNTKKPTKTTASAT